MHIYLFLALFGVSVIFLLASFLIKNTDEYDKYSYRLSCCIIAFVMFWALAPMAFDLTYVQEPQVIETFQDIQHEDHVDLGNVHHIVVQNITTTFTFGDPVVVHISESWMFTHICQGFGYVAFAFMFFYALALAYDLIKYKRGGP